MSSPSFYRQYLWCYQFGSSSYPTNASRVPLCVRCWGNEATLAPQKGWARQSQTTYPLSSLRRRPHECSYYHLGTQSNRLSLNVTLKVFSTCWSKRVYVWIASAARNGFETCSVPSLHKTIICFGVDIRAFQFFRASVCLVSYVSNSELCLG